MKDRTKLIRNPEWRKHRKEILSKDANINSRTGTGTKRISIRVGQPGHQPYRKRRIK